MNDTKTSCLKVGRLAVALASLLTIGMARADEVLYRPESDPGADLRVAIGKASVDGRRVLAVVGTDYCIWCFWFARHLQRDETARRALNESFELIHVYYGEQNENTAFFARLPNFERFPHLYVFDTSGEVQFSRDASLLMRDGRFDTERIVVFAADWAPTKAECAKGVPCAAGVNGGQK